MDGFDFISSIPRWLIVALMLCAIGLVVSAAVALFGFFFKAGVVIHEARKPPHSDQGDYRLEQGREIRPEAERRDRHTR
jgi:hypothetical protein